MGVVAIPINSRVFTQIEPEGSVFTRPTDWLPITQLVSDGDEKVVFLCAIFDQPTNVISMRISGDYTVDWGDGSATEDFTAGTLSSKDISFSSISATTNATTTEGEVFRQVIVTVTPQTGESLTSLDFSELPATATGIDDWLNPLLDIKISGSSISSLSFNSTDRGCYELAIFDYIGANSISSFDDFLGNGNLQEIKNLDTSGVSSLIRFCQNNNLSVVPLFDLSSMTNGVGFLQNNNLTSVPLWDLSSMTDGSNFLRDNNLTSVPLWDLSSMTDGGNFLLDNNLTNVPLWDLSSMTSGVGFLQANSLTSVPLWDLSSMTNGGDFLQDNNLTSVPLWDLSSMTNGGGFLQSNSLISAPLWDLSSMTNGGNFLRDNNLISVPLWNLSSMTNGGSFLRDNNLTSVPLWDLSSMTSGGSFLQNNNLTSVPLWDLSSMTSGGSFLRENNLISVPLWDLSSMTSGVGFLQSNLIARLRAENINFSLNVSLPLGFIRLSQPALVEIFNNLVDRSATTSRNINISGTNGAGDLTSAERQIATDKNWTITG